MNNKLLVVLCVGLLLVLVVGCSKQAETSQDQTKAGDDTQTLPKDPSSDTQVTGLSVDTSQADTVEDELNDPGLDDIDLDLSDW
ncbi:hypothetical protein GOV05_03205 [Candidatus Woesearchaeota archaeon]|nr:hypothetical protein [Candidatus Woesearchaeota archaeon]